MSTEATTPVQENLDVGKDMGFRLDDNPSLDEVGDGNYTEDGLSVLFDEQERLPIITKTSRLVDCCSHLQPRWDDILKTCSGFRNIREFYLFQESLLPRSIYHLLTIHHK